MTPRLAMRPPSARISAAPADAPIPPPLVAIAAIALLVMGASILAFRRR